MRKTPLTFAVIFAGILVVLALFAAMRKPATTTPQTAYQNNNQTVTQGGFNQPSNNQAVGISFSPQARSVNRGETFEVTLTAATSKTILATDLYLKYDPQSITIIRITPGTYFENPTEFYNQVDNTHGTTIYSLGAVKPKNNQGSLITITVKAKNTTGDTALTLEPKTLISTRENEKETITLPEPGTYTIQ